MKKLLLALAAAASTVGACTPAPALACYSDGARRGIVQKFSHKGLILKTYEGELVTSGFKFGTTGAGSNVWKFSAKDDAIGEKLHAAMSSQQEVVLTYCQLYVKMVTDTDYIITDVKFVGQ
ncbi:MAG TPA: hypothetical protein VFM18_00620 [Methanosarcina sp.]|nr:hypothetical protein [Methanosarcina sp.]